MMRITIDTDAVADAAEGVQREREVGFPERDEDGGSSALDGALGVASADMSSLGAEDAGAPPQWLVQEIERARGAGGNGADGGNGGNGSDPGMDAIDAGAGPAD
jgi:hypothetical protein